MSSYFLLSTIMCYKGNITILILMLFEIDRMVLVKVICCTSHESEMSVEVFILCLFEVFILFLF